MSLNVLQQRKLQMAQATTQAAKESDTPETTPVDAAKPVITAETPEPVIEADSDEPPSKHAFKSLSMKRFCTRDGQWVKAEKGWFDPKTQEQLDMLLHYAKQYNLVAYPKGFDPSQEG